MLLSKILPNFSAHLSDMEITGISCNSKDVKNGYAFVCIQGTNVDGHNYALDAINNGAAVVVTQRDLGIENQIIVSDTHVVYATMCANWFDNPAKDLRLIGVTGTNGKTSVTYMLKSVLENSGSKVGLIGTIQNMIGDEAVVSHNTTPNAYELNSLFSLMRAKGCEFVIMEVSSHALDQCRVYDLKFDVAIFTNLTQDHLDYHKTMENYLNAKKKLFNMCGTAVVNKDDAYYEQLVQGLGCEIITCSTDNDSIYSAKAIKYRPDGVDYELVSDISFNHISVKTGGKFTVYNSMLVAVTALKMGIEMDIITKSLQELEGIKGRAEVVPNDRDFTIIIDYAHTPDGLKNILSTFRECEKERLIVLFGCGGDRDRTKRPKMGNIAVHNADYVIVTSDNPRSEEPMAIIDDILEGTQGVKTPVKVIENRIEAIKYAVSIARRGDILVLAGKGHETYQILKSGTIHLDEREIIKEALAELS
ncbi:MAG: UDP-N-acetylmuramoyl-L-alanyl-D-glutamate--2,6-diaminopimelate ligase [Clostridia bacterium]|nr:UDP-N-acetylmuramoyl-L-alanyl-D-glutamate--2,6-diaminopimelate ligase [Clostridia bacterium]